MWKQIINNTLDEDLHFNFFQTPSQPIQGVPGTHNYFGTRLRLTEITHK